MSWCPEPEALGVLKNKGLIVGVAGYGTFVAGGRSAQQPAAHSAHLAAHFRRAGACGGHLGDEGGHPWEQAG